MKPLALALTLVAALGPAARFVGATVRNTATPNGRVNPYRMQLELELRAGRWLTSDLQFVA